MESSDPFVNELMLVESALSVSCAGAHESEELNAVASTWQTWLEVITYASRQNKEEDIYCILFSLLEFIFSFNCKFLGSVLDWLLRRNSVTYSTGFCWAGNLMKAALGICPFSKFFGFQCCSDKCSLKMKS